MLGFISLLKVVPVCRGQCPPAVEMAVASASEDRCGGICPLDSTVAE